LPVNTINVLLVFMVLACFLGNISHAAAGARDHILAAFATFSCYILLPRSASLVPRFMVSGKDDSQDAVLQLPAFRGSLLLS